MTSPVQPGLPIGALSVSLLLLSCLSIGVVHGATSAATMFSENIAPIMEKHCVSCHGPEKQKSQLRLDQASNLVQGGSSGEPLFIPGKAAESLLYQVVSGSHADLQMPPKGEPLTPTEVSLIKQWIDQEAVFGSQPIAPPEIKTEHWSFQSPDVVRPPSMISHWGTNAIDAFIQDSLNKQGLQPSQPTSRNNLIRRLYLVALGLPPSPEEVAAFVQDEHPAAYLNLVDRVLASPHYGERWARHWLDVVRYADTNGFETNRERKTAYRYRDYVIDAFNQDLPYDQFIVDQIAGDSTGRDVATGFLVAGPYDIVKSPDINLTLAQRQDELADMVGTTATSFLGLTLGCARCHNHKFDPLLQKDYYAIQAVFAGVKHGERTLPIPSDTQARKRIQRLAARLATTRERLAALKRRASATTEATPAVRRPAVNFQKNEERFPSVKTRFLRLDISQTTGNQEPCIDELEVYTTKNENVAHAKHGTTAEASGTLPGYEIHQLEHINDGQTGNHRSWISDSRGKGWIILEFSSPQTIERIVWSRDRLEQFRDRLATQYSFAVSMDKKNWQTIADSESREPFSENANPLDFIKKLAPRDAESARSLLTLEKALQSQITDFTEGPKAWVANFSKPPPTHRLYRGEPLQKRELVAPDGLTVMGSLGMQADEPEAQRRFKLARWIASKENPLTARVMVNRLWQHSFGKGIVATPSDLGQNGIPPSHPELLDWLAGELIRANWSLKHIHRLIFRSETFQQSSRPRPPALEQDADSTYLWRFPPRRLEAEAIRDSILSASGSIDLRQGGPGFYLHRVQVENVMHYFPKESFGPEEFRRMVYLFKIRQEQDAIFGSFDCPDGNQTLPRRSRSNTPLQALNLFNSQFTLQQAEQLTKRLRQEAGPAPDQQITLAFQLLFARTPDSVELEAAVQLVEGEGLNAFCRALFNASEFLFLF